MTDVLLVNTPMCSPRAQASFDALCPPLGLGYLAACLQEEGITVEIVDLSLVPDPWGYLEQTVARTSPRMAGIT